MMCIANHNPQTDTPSTASVRPRQGFTLVELLVVIGILALLISILLPAASRVREQSNRVRCSNNLRQIALAMIAYSRAEPDDALPRTLFNPTANQLQLDNTGFGNPNPFGKSGYVENNVPSTLYLLMKSQNLSPVLFICPSTDWGPPLDKIKQQQSSSSNWEQIPRDMTYSMATPFPSAAATRAGFKWKTPMRDDFVLAGDINPGTRGPGAPGNPPNNVVGPNHDASMRDLSAANSNNHRNRGQNVLYGDSHVEFQETPYCGAYRDNGLRDNIYTAGAGEGGVCSQLAQPVDEKDTVLLPTDDPKGN